MPMIESETPRTQTELLTAGRRLFSRCIVSLTGKRKKDESACILYILFATQPYRAVSILP